MELANQAADALARSRALGNLGSVHLRLGLPGAALRLHAAHLAAATAAGDVAAQARAHGNAGAALAAVGRHAEAAAAHAVDAELAQGCGDRRGLAQAKLHWSAAMREAGAAAEVVEAGLAQAATLARDVGAAEVRRGGTVRERTRAWRADGQRVEGREVSGA